MKSNLYLNFKWLQEMEFHSIKGASPLKMMKTAFYFTLKALLVLKIFKFLSWIFGHVKNGLIRKIRLISEFMTSQTA